MRPAELAAALIRCPSVTPADAGALDVLSGALSGLGFAVHLLSCGEPPDGPVRNLFATIGDGAPHFAFAGHTDVVPAGDAAAWITPAFDGRIEDGMLHGRGAADMKGALAAMVAASAAVLPLARGTLSFLITGDEEGPATHGTRALLDWMEAQGHRPDMCLVGEPTSAGVLGDTVKIGRRGSLNTVITVHGTQGHVAYPDRADNPVSPLIRILAELQARDFADATAHFQASNLEVTSIDVGNPANNVTPASATARLNIRFNERQRGRDLGAWIEQTVATHAPRAECDVRISGEAFLTEPGELSTLVSDAVRDVTGLSPALSTSGGTSDARFIRRVCPVIEFGLPGTTMHQVNERVSVADVDALTAVYTGVLRRVFAAG